MINLVSASKLDSLMIRIDKGKIESRTVKGFVVSRSIMPLIPIEKETSTTKKFEDTVSKNSMSKCDSLNLRITNLENKLTIALNSMQEQSENHTTNINFIMKLFESSGTFLAGLTGLIGTIMGIIAFFRRKKKKML